MAPKVSIILPYFEGEDLLPRALASIRGQTEPGWELIVVDDGSVRPPGRILDDLADGRVRCVRITHSGKGAALNRGVEAARSETLCFIDQDDLMRPRRLETQLARLARDPGTDGVYSDYERRRADGSLIDRVTHLQVPPEEALRLLASGRSPLTMQTLMLRRGCFQRVGGFSEDPRLTGLDDLEFFTRLLLSEPTLVHVPGVVQTWVRHDRNYSGGPAFQEARVHCLERLAQLSTRQPRLRKHLRRFRSHAHAQRGIYFLEAGEPGRAVRPLFEALHARPLSPNTAYLLLKALVQSACTA